MAQSVDLASLPIHQLQSIRHQIEEDLSVLTSSFSQLRSAQAKFTAALAALEPLNADNKDQTILVPMTNSLYIPGTLNNVEKVIVDVGTGYFMEKAVPDAKNFYQRKVDFLRENLEKVSETISAKQSQLKLVMDVVSFKLNSFEKERQKAPVQEQVAA